MDNSFDIVLPRVTIVVIGHNEAKNLDNCFGAIQKMDYPAEKLEVIFVDSKSNDNSVEVAKKYTENIYCEKSNWPTAGEAFNRGILESTAEFVHITGGDIQLDTDYLKKAVHTLLERNDIDCVTGFFVEKNMSGWNKVLAFRREEDTSAKAHFVSSPNGGTFRKEAFYKVNGYDERIKKGQETEIGQCFEEAGLKIWHMKIQQGVHDFGLNTTIDMINRSIGSGFSMGHLLILSLFERSNKHLFSFRKSAIRNLSYNSFFITLLIIMIYFGGLLFILIWLAIYLGYYPLRAIIGLRKSTWNYKRYNISMGYFSIFSYFGIMKFLLYYLKLRLKGVNLMHSKYGLNVKQEKA